jgi:hypothetical protein
MITAILSAALSVYHFPATITNLALLMPLLVSAESLRNDSSIFKKLIKLILFTAWVVFLITFITNREIHEFTEVPKDLEYMI